MPGHISAKCLEFFTHSLLPLGTLRGSQSLVWGVRDVDLFWELSLSMTVNAYSTFGLSGTKSSTWVLGVVFLVC